MYLLSVIVIFFLGAAVGSFLNVAAGRYGSGRSFIRGRSSCPHCDRKLAWRDMIPVASWILLRARCRRCRGGISLQYPLVEIAIGLLFVCGFVLGYASWHAVVYLLAVCFFAILFLVDLRLYVIPDSISIPAIVIILTLNSVLTRDPVTYLVGASAGALWFWMQYTVSKGRWVGGGDMRLGALMGALLGHPYVWLGLMVSYVAGSIIALALIVLGKKKMKSTLPFATMLLPGALATWMFGGTIWTWYSGLFGF